MSTYTRETAERMALNLARHDNIIEAYDIITDCPELWSELILNDLTYSQLFDRIEARNSGESDNV